VTLAERSPPPGP